MKDKTEKQFNEGGYLLYSIEMGNDKTISKIDIVLFGIINVMSKNGKGSCYAKNGTLAKYIGCSTRSISESLSKMEQRGFIVRSFDEENGQKRNGIRPLITFNGTKRGVQSGSPLDMNQTASGGELDCTRSSSLVHVKNEKNSVQPLSEATESLPDESEIYSTKNNLRKSLLDDKFVSVLCPQEEIEEEILSPSCELENNDLVIHSDDPYSLTAEEMFPCEQQVDNQVATPSEVITASSSSPSHSVPPTESGSPEVEEPRIEDDPFYELALFVCDPEWGPRGPIDPLVREPALAVALSYYQVSPPPDNFPKLFSIDQVRELENVLEVWSETDPVNTKKLMMKWLVRQTRIDMSTIISEMIPMFIEFVESSSPSTRKGRNLLVWLRDWLISARRRRKFPFTKTNDGHWLADNTVGNFDRYKDDYGIRLFISGGYDAKKHMETAFTAEDDYYYREIYNRMSRYEWNLKHPNGVVDEDEEDNEN